MLIKSIASSSEGNCYLISDGSTSLVIECGIPIKKIASQIDLAKVDGCLITHEHRDHSAAFRDMHRHTTIYASKGTLDVLNDKRKVASHMRVFQKVLTHSQPMTIKSFVVLPFNTQHDAAEPLGFLIYSKSTGERLLFATDTYYIKNQFRDLNYIMIECNYSKDLLSDDLSKTERLRLLQSHFELGNVKKFLNATDLSKCKKIYLLHLSARNSDAKRFKKEIQEETGVLTYVCDE